MKTKKEFKYYLKKDVRDDLDFLYVRLSALLHHDDEGFNLIPSWSILSAFFKVYSHLLWCNKFESWFKKVYK